MGSFSPSFAVTFYWLHYVGSFLLRDFYYPERSDSLRPLLAALLNTRQRSKSPFANKLSSSYKLTQLFAQVCAIPLLSACRLFYLYKKVPARQTSPIDKMRRLHSQHFEYNPNQMCDTVLTMNVLADGCTEINYTVIIPQYIDFVNRVFTAYSVFVMLFNKRRAIDFSTALL